MRNPKKSKPVMKKIKQSVIVPVCLAIYLGIMAYIGRDNFTSDNKFTYYSVLAVSLVIIVILHFVLRKKNTYGRGDKKNCSMADTTIKIIVKQMSMITNRVFNALVISRLVQKANRLILSL